VRSAALAWATAAWEQREICDTRIERLAPQWPPPRQPGVDRNILRLAVWEMTNSPTPPKVVLDEAIELAKQFSTEQSAAFVNGVLDAVLREHRALTEGSELGVHGSDQEQTPEPHPPEPLNSERLNPEP
jgi:N utilization substance protein B